MHASGESFQESRMREIRTSGLMRGGVAAPPTLLAFVDNVLVWFVLEQLPLRMVYQWVIGSLARGGKQGVRVALQQGERVLGRRLGKKGHAE